MLGKFLDIEAMRAKVGRSRVPNFDLDLGTKMSGTASATSTWLHPPDRPEIIDTLINGVGMARS
jgi:hypothetical protein